MHIVAPCPSCAGGQAACQLCRGKNQVEFFRCPNALLTRNDVEAVRAAAMVEVGILPDTGGWMDQACTFVQAFTLIARQSAFWKERERENERRKAARQQQRR